MRVQENVPPPQSDKAASRQVKLVDRGPSGGRYFEALRGNHGHTGQRLGGAHGMVCPGASGS